MKIVLAYSGGLDTSVALRWLADNYDAEIIAFCADLGQADDLQEIASKAKATGAARVHVEDLRAEFLEDFCFPALRAGAAYEGQYLLAAPLGRPLIAQHLVRIAHQEGATMVAHGATGKGNDQVRFYCSVMALDPTLQVVAPVIEWEMRSREDEIEYAHRHAIPITITPERPFSIDTNVWGSSIECGPLDDLERRPAADVYQITRSPEQAPEQAVEVRIGFVNGRPTVLDGESVSSLSLVERLNYIGGQYGIGRIDILENRVVGIKTRGVYESPAATILHAAYRELEGLVQDRDTLHFKVMIAQRYAQLVYDGHWFSPLRLALDGFVNTMLPRMTGEVTLQLYKGRITPSERRSVFAQYQHDLSTYAGGDTFDHRSGTGFAYIWSLPLRIAAMTDTGVKAH